LSEGTGVTKPHGGNLVNRFSNIDPSGLSSISISADLANDVENIADGIFSPLEGFLSQQDFENVVEKGRLSNDIPWTIPIVLDVDESTASKIKGSGNVFAHTIAQDKQHPLAEPFHIDRFTTGGLIDEHGAAGVAH